jgi:hypothetical protein
MRTLAAVGLLLMAPLAAWGQSSGGSSGNGGCTGNCSFTGINGWTPDFVVRMDSVSPPAVAGTGYVTGDTVTLNAGCATNPVVVVAATAGAITTDSVLNSGACLTIPTNPVGALSTSGVGTGASFTLKWAPLAGQVASTSSVPGANQGNFIFGTAQINGAPLAFSGNESFFIAPYVGNITSGGFTTVVGPGNCGAVSGVPVFGGALTCIGSNAGRNLAGNNANSIYIGNFGNASSPNITGTSMMVISAGDTPNLTTPTQSLLIQTGCGPAATIAGVTCLGYKSRVNAAGAQSVVVIGANGAGGGVGAFCNTNGTCIGPSAGNANMTGFDFTLMGYQAAHVVCGAGHDLLMISTGQTAVDCPTSTTSNWSNITNSFIANLTAPTINSGFGTGASVTAGLTSGGFSVNVGTGGTASSGLVNISIGNNAPNGWACNAVDGTNPASSDTVVTPTTPSTVTLTNYNRTTGAVAPWAASDIITVGCNGF